MANEKITWRNSPWTVVIGFPLFAFLIIVLVLLPRSVRNKPDPAIVCRSNLKQLQLMKNLWAEDEHKGTNDVPTELDLFGTNENLRSTLRCPLGGTYTIGSIAEKPHCSIPGHTI